MTLPIFFLSAPFEVEWDGWMDTCDLHHKSGNEISVCRCIFDIWSLTSAMTVNECPSLHFRWQFVFVCFGCLPAWSAEAPTYALVCRRICIPTTTLPASQIEETHPTHSTHPTPQSPTPPIIYLDPCGRADDECV